MKKEEDGVEVKESRDRLNRNTIEEEIDGSVRF